MSLRSLLLSSDEKTVKVLRRVLSDLEISVDHCSTSEAALRKLTRQRFEAVIVDCLNLDEAREVLKSAQSSPANNRAVAIVLVEASIGLRGGFEMGGHFVLHKPLSGERARSSFRAVRAMMKRERRRQARVAVQLPVECQGLKSGDHYKAHTIDLCEGGMAVQFQGRFVKEGSLRFSLDLPGTKMKLELEGEVAWEGRPGQAGVRFISVPDERLFLLRRWLGGQLPELEPDDPPLNCRLSDLSLGGCYLETNSPFCVRTRVILSMKTGDFKVWARGVVRIMHPEFGMGIEFSRSTPAQHEQVHAMIEMLRANGATAAELKVEPDGLETMAEDSAAGEWPEADDSLVDLFRQKADVPIEAFLQEMRQQRRVVELK